MHPCCTNNRVQSSEETSSGPATTSLGPRSDLHALMLEQGFAEADIQRIPPQALTADDAQAVCDSLGELLRLRLSRSIVARLCCRAPGFLLAPLSTWTRFLTASGFSDAQIQHIITSEPAMLQTCTIVDAGRAMLHMKELGLKDQRGLLQLVTYYPQTLGMQKDSIATVMQIAAKFQGTIDASRTPDT